MLFLSRVGQYANKVYRSKAGLWLPGQERNTVCSGAKNVLAVIRRKNYAPVYMLQANIVTDAGDIYYAERSAGEAPTNAFDTLELQTAGTPGKSANRSDFTAHAGSQRAFAGGYPKTDDDDASNTGADTDVVTYKASYSSLDGPFVDITHGIITNDSPGASEPILTGFAFASTFSKDDETALEVFINHTMGGV